MRDEGGVEGVEVVRTPGQVSDGGGGVMICYMLSFLKQGLRLQRYHVIPFLDVLNLNFTKLLSSNSFLYFKKSSSDLNVCLMQG